MNRLAAAAALILAALLPGAARAEESKDLPAVRELLLQTYDKPSAPLKLQAIVVEEDSAIADWSQGDLAGRAFLRRRDGKWSIALCAGDALRNADALAKLGVQQAHAEALARKLAEAERALSREELEKMGRFDRMVEFESQAGAPAADPHHRLTP
jgi:hypothetical protein